MAAKYENNRQRRSTPQREAEYAADLPRRRRSLLPNVSVNTLKIVGAVLMSLYFSGAAVIQNGILHVHDYSAAGLNELLGADPQAMLWAGVASVAEIVGMIAISIYAYLLVQGVQHTSSMGKYALSVLAFALISEVPYDLAMYGQVWSLESQNTLWAVFIALVALWLMRCVENRGAMTYVLSVVAILGGCLWAALINCKFGWGFVLIAGVMYLLRRWRTASLIAGLAVSLVYVTAAMGFILISMCDDQRRTGEKKLEKYAYYAYYPLLLVLLAVWGRLV